MPKRGQSKHLHDRSPSGLSPIRWLGSQRNPTSHAELGPLHFIQQKYRSTRFSPGMLHAMSDVNGSFQSMRIEKTYPESAFRSARLMALCKRPQIEDLIARLTDAAFLAESLAKGQP